MKKVREPLSDNFKHVRLYRDDIEKIEEIAIDELKTNKFSVEFGEHVYDSVKEISKDSLDSHKVTIYIRNPYIYLYLSETNTYLHGSNENLEAEGAYNSISKIISAREHKLTYYFLKAGSLVGPPVLTLSVFGTIFLAKEKSAMFYLAMISLVPCLYWVYSSYQHDFKYSSTVIFENIKSRPAFFIRKKDDIIINILIAGLFYILGLYTKNL